MSDNPETYVVWGPPGTGKTTYLITEAKALDKWAKKRYGGLHKHPVLLCSLTKAAAAEIAGRDLPLPSECIGTLHSHAYRALGRQTVAETQVEDFNKCNPNFRLSKAKGDKDSPGWERKQETPADSWFSEYQLYRARQTNRQLWKPRVAMFAKQWEDWKESAGAIDFTDMIELALLQIPAPPGDPLVMIADEAQDLSSLEFALLRKWGKATGKLIITGDPYQALYAWRGAHPGIFMDPAIPANRRKVLGQSYRVPRAVHKASLQWISQLSTFEPIEYKPRDFDGTFGKCTGNWLAPRNIIAAATKYLDRGKSVMIISSCSYQLSPTLKALRQRGIPFANPWRAVNGGWNPLAQRRGTTMPDRILAFLRFDFRTWGDDYRFWNAQELWAWASVISSSELLQRGRKNWLAGLAKLKEPYVFSDKELKLLFMPEKIVPLLRLFQSREPGGKDPATMRQLLDWWQQRLLGTVTRQAQYPLTVADNFGIDKLEDRPQLYIGTAHSFKGSEADVAIVLPDLSPAGFREWSRPGEPKDSVIRLFYVAMTRARETTLICEPCTNMAANMRPLLNDCTSKGE